MKTVRVVCEPKTHWRVSRQEGITGPEWGANEYTGDMMTTTQPEMRVVQ